MGLFDWLDFFSFAWLRRCKTCGERGSKCVCKRPSVALEHIFFLEERKNKYGARNFSHVSDTVMTVGTNSTTFTNSTIFSSSTANAAGFANSGVNFNSNNTVIMGGGADSVSECASVDYIYRASSQPSIAGSAQGPNYRQLPTTTSSSQHRRHHRRSRRHQEPEAEPASGALVRKHSGRMVRKAYSDTTGFSRFEELPADYPLTAENLEAATSSHGSQRSAGSHTGTILTKRSANARQQQDSRTVTFRPENPLAPRHSRLKKQGSSFKFYGRGGSGVSSEVATGISSSSTSTGRALSSSAVSSDAIVVRPSNASSSAMGSSFCSDRMSVDNNYGSYNPRAGRMIEGGYAPSIQEEEEVLQRLDGWLHSSPTSTADSFMMSRAMF